jgi:hypothetical protein
MSDREICVVALDGGEERGGQRGQGEARLKKDDD